MSTIDKVKNAISEMQVVEKKKSRLRMGKPRTEGHSAEKVQESIHAARDEFVAFLESLNEAQGISVISLHTRNHFLSIDQLIACYKGELNVNWDVSGLEHDVKMTLSAIK